MSIPGDNASSNGRGPDLEVWDDPVPLWLYRLPDGSTGGVSYVPVPLIAGAVVAGDVRGMLHAVDAETGAVRWRFQTDATEVSAALAAAPTLPSHAGLVYATGWAGLSALEAASGAERWRFPPDGGIGFWRLHPADGAVYVGNRHGLNAVDAETGAVRWRFVPDGNRPVRSSYSLATAAVVLVVDAEGRVYGVDSAGGRLLWRSRLPADFSAESQVVAEVTGVVVFVDPHWYHDLVALDLATGAERWRFEVDPHAADGSASIEDVQVAGGVVCVALSRGHVHALDGATGAERWRYRAGVDAAGIWPVDGALYVDSGDDDSFDSALAALDPASGAERWRFGGFAGMVIDLRRLGGAVVIDLFGHGDVGVYAIDDATGAERWRYEADFRPGSERFPAWRVLAGGAVVASAGPPRGWTRQFPGRRRRRGGAPGARPTQTPYLRAFTPSGLVAIDPRTGAEVWRVESAGHPITDPVLADGRLYFVGRAGHSSGVALYAYAVGGAQDADAGA